MEKISILNQARFQYTHQKLRPLIEKRTIFIRKLLVKNIRGIIWNTLASMRFSRMAYDCLYARVRFLGQKSVWSSRKCTSRPLYFFSKFVITCLIAALVHFQTVRICTFGPARALWKWTKSTNSCSLWSSYQIRTFGPLSNCTNWT